MIADNRDRGGRYWRLVLVCLAGLLLGGCSEDWGADQQGQPVRGDWLDGHWLVLNVWAEWCGPCREEVPELNRLQVVEGIRVLGINHDGLRDEALRQSAERLGIRFRVLQDSPLVRLGIEHPQGLPVTYILDPGLQLRQVLAGPQTAAGLQAAIRQLQSQGATYQ